MPIDVLLKKKHRELLTEKMNKTAKRIQRWFRDKLSQQKRGFKIGIWELKRMMETVPVIQRWWRKMKSKWAWKRLFKQINESTYMIQYYARKFLKKIHEKKVKRMEQSFDYFEKMRIELCTASQIKIAGAMRGFLARKRAREEQERIEMEK